MLVEIYRMPKVLTVTQFSRSFLYQQIGDGMWTRPVKLGPRAVGWPSNEIQALIGARIAGRRPDEIRALVKQLIGARRSMGANGDEDAGDFEPEPPAIEERDRAKPRKKREARGPNEAAVQPGSNDLDPVVVRTNPHQLTLEGLDFPVGALAAPPTVN